MKQYTNKRSVQLLSFLMTEYGIRRVVVSPGSRNAPLAIQFQQLDSILPYSIVDERSAGFVALGMAQQSKMPVALCCTSGSAATNYYPAVVEAFYQNIPLLILTADRPVTLVDQFDGQTIRQQNLYSQHSYGSYQLVEDYHPGADTHNRQSIIQAIEACFRHQGPVHINIPLSEPLYDLVTELPDFAPVIEKNISPPEAELYSRIIADWNTHKRVLILLGSLPPDPEMSFHIRQLTKNHSCVVLHEAGSNYDDPKAFGHIDRYISGFDEDDIHKYAPEILITVGQNVVSKRVKTFLRKARPKIHWHIDPHWQPDTYGTLTEGIATRPGRFFLFLNKHITPQPQPYFNLWRGLKDRIDHLHEKATQSIPYSDLRAYQSIFQKLPEDYILQISNSAAIRYAQLFPTGENREIRCNRGTSGIDGCTSTAMGYAMLSEKPVLLLSGDISFLYDINGLWNQMIPPYTRIIVINNGEGNIFRIIPGPDRTEAINEFIATCHHHKLEHLAKHFGLDYFRVEEDDSLQRSLDRFFEKSQRPKLLEIFTGNEENAQILKDYFKQIHLI